MADAEGETGLFRKREEALAINTYVSNRNELVKFYENLARMGREKIPPEMKSEDEAASSNALSAAQKNLDDAVRYFSENAAKLSDEGVSTAVARLCLAMFLLERAKKLREISLKMNDLGTFSLYVTLRNRIAQSLSPEFFARSSRGMIDAWLDLDPLLAACSELCGLKAPELREVLDEYHPRVVDAVERLGK